MANPQASCFSQIQKVTKAQRLLQPRACTGATYSGWWLRLGKQRDNRQLEPRDSDTEEFFCRGIKHQQAKQSHNSTLRHRGWFPSPHPQYVFIIKTVPTTFLSLKQHYWKIVTNLCFSSFRRSASPLFYFTCSHRFEAVFKITDCFFTRSSRFFAFTKQERNPCCFPAENWCSQNLF